MAVLVCKAAKAVVCAIVERSRIHGRMQSFAESQGMEAHSGRSNRRGASPAPFFGVIPDAAKRRSGLRRQDAEANIGKADGLKGEPQDAASSPATFDKSARSRAKVTGFRLAAG
ncbi:MAG TPA: hypothetical protein VJL61_02425 [Rhodanobacteraceae bacterium]|nr:hypothetical protein [Rhodanobacteraceae bacterium]